MVAGKLAYQYGFLRDTASVLELVEAEVVGKVTGVDMARRTEDVFGRLDVGQRNGAVETEIEGNDANMAVTGTGTADEEGRAVAGGKEVVAGKMEVP